MKPIVYGLLLAGQFGLGMVFFGGSTSASEPHCNGRSNNLKTQKWLTNFEKQAQNNQVDQLIEQAVYHWEPSHKEAAWTCVGELVYKLIKWEQQQFQRADLKTFLVDGEVIAKPLVSVGGLKLWNLRDVAAPELVWINSGGKYSYLARVGKLEIKDGLAPGIYVSAGPIELAGGYIDSSTAFLANDSVTLSPKKNVVICDGEFKGPINNSIVIARGGVTYHSIGGSLVLSSGPVRAMNQKTVIGNSTVISASKVQVPEGSKVFNSVIKENVADALEPIKFFEPAQVGIEVEMVKEAVRIKKLDPTKAFAKGGLKVDDIVLLLNGERVRTDGNLRKMLRHELAGNAPLQFQVRRGEKTLSIAVLNKMK